METVKYILEFFFGDFWHFVMLFLVCLAISPKVDKSIHLYGDEEKE